MASYGKVGGNAGILVEMSINHRPVSDGLQKINRQLSMHRNEMRTVNRVYQATGREGEALADTYKIMSKQMQTLEEKHSVYMEKLKGLKEGSKDWEKQQMNVNRVRQEIAKLTIEMQKNKDAQAKQNIEGKKYRDNLRATNEYAKTHIERLKLQGRHVEAFKEEQRRLKNAIEQTNNILRTEEKVLEKVKNQFKENSAEVTKQRTKMEKLRLETDKYQNKLKEAGKSVEYFVARDRLMRTGLGKTLGAIKTNRAAIAEFRNAMLSFGAGATVLSLPLKRAFTGSIGAVVEWEDAFAQVRKTVNDATEKEFKQLDKDIMNMSKTIPESATLIAETMGLAAQLGVAKENLSGFTEVALQMGTATNLSVEEASQAMARFANVTGMEQTNKNFQRLGSAIVNLGGHVA